jgi:hypothetical protein
MDKKHTCDFCNKTYASASSKSTHIKKFHKNTEEKEIPVEKVIEKIPVEKVIPVEKEIPVKEKKTQKKKIKVEEKVQPVENIPVEKVPIKIKKSKKVKTKNEKCDDCDLCFYDREELFFHIVRNHKTEDIYQVFNHVSSDPNITDEDQEMINTVGELNEVLTEISETAVNYKKTIEIKLAEDLKDDPETTKELIYNHIKKKYGNKITEIMDESYSIIKQLARNFYQRQLDDFVNGGLIYTL